MASSSSSNMQEIKEYKWKQIQIMGLSQKNLAGSGSSAKIFKGTSGDMPVAIKVYKKSKKDQWEAERSLLTECKHPNIVRLMGYASEGDDFYLILEFIEGMTLQKAIKGLNWPSVVKILKEIHEGLMAIHAAGYVVGDIKPDNVMLTQTNEIKLIDFRSASKEKKINCRTAGYAAPEVDIAERSAEISVKSDIFSFGIIILQILNQSEIVNSSLRQRAIASREHKDHIAAKNLINTGCSEEQAKAIMDLGISCTEAEPNNRSSHTDVKKGLESLLTSMGKEERKKKKQKK